MKQHQKKLILAKILILTASISVGVEASNLSEKIDLLFDDRTEKPGCAVGVIEDGVYLHSKGYGFANLEHEIAIDSDTIFRIGSVSKQFTAMAIAILEEKGLLSFEDEMKAHIPDLIDYDQIVTINHMIHHYSGLGDYEYMDYPGRFKNAVGNEFRWGNEDYLSNEEFHDLIKTLPLIRKPEKKFWYSNTGYVLLAIVAENASGMSLRQFTEKEIFAPLGMNHSFFNDDVNLLFKNRADAYSPLDNASDEYKINVTNLSWVGDGGVYTSLNDFINWDQNFYKNRLGKEDESLIKTMEMTFEETQVSKRNQKMDREKENEGTYAFAQNLSYYNGYKRWSHSGSWVGWLAHYARFPELGFSTVVFCNTNEIDATVIADKVVDIYFENRKE
ncbi:MAG: penicillin-binding protein [Gammaproteobacteria bacterium]|jgi:CubicO group peptidase (beta-lactamase class C family)|nr:penicillin-binding protein [Gammaproteobacteria bacterium]|tara:strand:- start:13655 stop:14818 length:1164 start_codon:yes stop_codon:yes gene_type:complete